MKRKSKQASGGARLTASGKRAVLLGIAPEQHEIISAAAQLDGRKVTQFLTFHGLVAAKEILRKNGNNID